MASKFGEWMRETFASEVDPIPRPERVLERILNPYEDISYRVPFMFTSDIRKRNNIPPVRLRVNPRSVTFSQNKRITRRDTQAGAIYFHWANSLGSNNDVITINFSGQTGNINLRMGANRRNWASEQLKKLREWSQGVTKDQALEIESLSGVTKLMSFWNLYTITREPMIDVRNGSPVRYYAMYSSPIFANALIHFTGHFDRVLEFTDDADNPFNKNYSFSFVATSSDPPMDFIYRYLSTTLGREFFNELS